MSLNNIDPGYWRIEDNSRPWYYFAEKLLPEKKNQKVLDLGSGAGEFSEMLKKKGNNVYCCDFSKIYVNKLKRRAFKAKLADFNEKLPFKDNFFDGIVCLEVIEHIAKAEDFLKEINRVLKKSGWFIISTPNISWLGYRLLTLLGRVPFKEGYHLRYFNYYWLKKKIELVGFSVEKEACYTPIPIVNRIKQFWLSIKFWPNLFAQDLVFLCRK